MAEDAESGGEKTEDPSSRKLSKAREEGQVAKSIEIPSVFVLLSAVTAMYATAGYFYENLSLVFHHNLIFEKIPSLGINEAVRILAYHTQVLLMTCIPVMLAVVIVGLISNFAQVGFVISWKALEPKLSRLDPINGFKQKFTSRAVVEFVKTLLKIGIISLVAYYSIRNSLTDISVLYDASIGYILLFILKIAFWIFIKVCLIMIVVAILDYAYQKWKFLDDQKM
ncbi:MAG: EscU/YscU/HrcU family type III secretion system export apparatus switch protein, partial [Proteobacteria bacterium]|nr:EscU/YscU/HrcU family type III secretion system export apparatus switch protein [Pseudomonadota bacterium]